jgi:prepilin-type N-terminal cleavage/methylation domain-containing protein
MKTHMKGFTLIELVVVTLIMGILTSMAVPYYFKTVETSKATDSVALGHMIANSNRMYRLDNPTNLISGQITNSCNSQTNCAAASGACKLLACGYVAQQDWQNSSYDFYVCNGGAGGTCCSSSGTEIGVSCTKRKSGAAANYAGWGYVFYSSGRCAKLSTAPDCPKF